METNTSREDKPKFSIWHLALLFFLLSTVIFLAGKNAGDFMASVIPTKTAAPFDGTALPVLKVPKWTALSSAQYKAAYDAIPADKLITLPTYDPAILKTPTENLGWKTESDLNVRNAKITFSTPYMGNYKLDGVEYAGNHPAVDIKIPDNTPIYAIANGIVTEAVDQTTGYGKHIVIKHENVPSASDPSKKVTLYSSYNHLSELLVSEGDIVSKSQLIGKSGHTGTATTPHIHFQIDTSDAPWHPYWPFTYKEASAAGYSFFEAVNAGLNADKAKAVTINPMLYVQKYMSYSGSNSVSASSTPASSNNTVTTVQSDLPPPVTTVSGNTQTTSTTQTTATTVPVTQETVNTQSTTEVTTVPVPENTVTEPVVTAAPAVKFTLETDGSFVLNASEKMTITAVDAQGDTVVGYKPKDYVYLKMELGGANLPQYLSASDFVDGKAVFEFVPLSDNGIQIRVTDGSMEGLSSILQSSTFSDISESSESFKAINFLKKYGVITGYPDGTFQPDKVVTRVEALKFILGGANARLITDAKLPFKDAKAGEWYFDYVATGYSKSIVAGYKDNSFKPTNTVNRVEFLKMLILAMDLQMNPVVPRDLYDDVPKDAWFAPYVRYAKDKNIMEARGRNFNPEDGMTRAEVAETIYRTILVKLSESKSYSDGMSVSTAKVTGYFN
jgi:murein DD-endopeptidase MepM/ murein hydrolase activator NlpD